MITKYLLPIIFVFASISCSEYNPINYSVYKKAQIENVEVLKNGNYICFMTNERFIALFKYENSDDLKNYIGKKALLLKSKQSYFRVIDLNDNLVIAIEDYKDGPSPVVIIDLESNKNLLKGMYFSRAENNKLDQKYEILKLIGDRIKKEQEALIKKPIMNMEELANSLFKSGLGFEFYEKYLFDYQTRQLISENEVVPIVQKKFTWM
jgi:hypothetical protein